MTSPVKVLIEQWRREYNTIRPHSSLGYRLPAPEELSPDHALLNLPALRGPYPQSQGFEITLKVGPQVGRGGSLLCRLPPGGGRVAQTQLPLILQYTIGGGYARSSW